MLKNGALPKRTFECLGLVNGSMYFEADSPIFSLLSGTSS
jgi:hypothetical protein